MKTITDFEDMLALLAEHDVRYLIVGGLAFIYHAKPRYTKDMDLWLDPAVDNVQRANRALAEFGSPALLEAANTGEILQIGVAPNRIDLLRELGSASFESAWQARVAARYGAAPAQWISAESLLEIKSAIDEPRHQDDARVLRQVLALRRDAAS